jgi:hypothetical protein
LFVSEEIHRLLNIGAIEKCEKVPKCVSPINVVPKRHNKYRLIIDLRHLNKHCEAPRFVNEDIRTVKQLIKKNDYLATIDLKDGFLHVPIAVDDRDLLGFCWKGCYYRFTRLPFGLCVSPYIFAKLVRPVVTYLRSLGLRVVAFVDDFILMSESSSFTDHCDLVLDTLGDLGWSINFEKSEIQAKTCAIYLGHKITSCGMSGYPEIAVTAARIRKLKRTIRRVLTRETIVARQLASFAGQCVAMAAVVLPAKLLLRACYRLLKTKNHWSSLLVINKEVRGELQWWLQYVQDWNVCPIVVRPVQLQLVTDASHIAWGATLGTLKASGQWNRRLACQSSNYREIMAILLAIQTFQDILKDKAVQILTDNATALAYIINKGGPSKALTDVATAIWVLCTDLNIQIQVAHIKGVDNTEADRLSRIPDKYNWKLHPGLFRLIDRIMGPHTVDRFASGVNTQLPRFNARFWEPYSEGVDALAQQNWGQELNFVNAPFRLLGKVLEVVTMQRAEATVIAPWWPGQTWFRKLQSMSVMTPFRIPNKKQSFMYMGSTPEPLRNRKWAIYAWRISGQNAWPD